MSKLLVTGASGGLGRLVLDRLLAKNADGHTIIAATRNPEKLADYAKRGVEVRRADFDDAASLEQAFAGVDRILLISTDAIDRRLEQQRRAVAAAEKAGVKHVTYTSLPKPVGSVISIAESHAKTEEALAASKLAFTILRNNLYLHFMTDAVKGALATGQLVNARGNGKTAFVTREDCAHAAAHALLNGGTDRNTWDVTGPEALTSAEVAAIVTKVFGKKVEHVNVSPADFKAGLLSHGLPEPVADLLASFDTGISKGNLEDVADTVKRLSGETPVSVEQWLTKNRAIFS